MARYLPALALALAIGVPAVVHAQEPIITVDPSVQADVLANVAGGMRAGVASMALAAVSAELDGGAVGVPGLTARITLLGAAGDEPGALVGDLQGVSNIAAPGGVVPFEAWLEQELLGGRASVLAGLYDVNSEFDVLETAGLFLHSSFGIGADFGLSGPNGPSIFPVTGLAVRAWAEVGGGIGLRLAAVDGTPGDPSDPGAFDPRVRPGDGVLLAGEVSRSRVGSPTRLAAGAWQYRDAGTNVQGQRACCGFYVLGETRIPLGRAGSPDRPAVGMFGRAGFARRGHTPVDRYAGFGVTGTGVVASRPADELGIGVALAWPDGDYLAAAGFPASRDVPETVIELSYRLRIDRGVYLQPDVQYVLHPAGMPGSAHALLVGVRLAIDP